jgi:hypothetical protein
LSAEGVGLSVRSVRASGWSWSAREGVGDGEAAAQRVVVVGLEEGLGLRWLRGAAWKRKAEAAVGAGSGAMAGRARCAQGGIGEVEC